MTSALLTELLCSLSIISILLLVGTFLRAKVKVFQKLFLPASVIGGFLGLLLGPQVMGTHAIFQFPETYINDWSLLPGILIVPIFAAVPLGMFMGKPAGENTSAKKNKTAPNVLKCFGIFAGLGALQAVVGYGTHLAYKAVNPSADLYRTFGYELGQGFCGGHGTAGAVGKILEGLGLDYWATAQGVTVTTATVGIIGGMLIGILLINIAARKGETAVLKKPGDIPAEMSQGFNRDISRQGVMGRETFMNSSIETISIHLALMLAACGIAYFLMDLLKKTGIAAFSSMPVWIYAMVVMFAINGILIKCNLSWAVDTKVKAKISGSMSDFAITAAIASLPVKAVMAYAIPLAIMCVLGFALTYLYVFKLHAKLFKGDYAFEHAIIAWGTGTGVMMTGMMLLKICDPDYETPALSDFSVGFSLLSLTGLITTPITLAVLATGTTMQNLLLGVVFLTIYTTVALGANAISRVLDRKEAAAPVATVGNLAD